MPVSQRPTQQPAAQPRSRPAIRQPQQTNDGTSSSNDDGSDARMKKIKQIENEVEQAEKEETEVNEEFEKTQRRLKALKRLGAAKEGKAAVRKKILATNVEIARLENLYFDESDGATSPKDTPRPTLPTSQMTVAATGATEASGDQEDLDRPSGQPCRRVRKRYRPSPFSSDDDEIPSAEDKVEYVQKMLKVENSVPEELPELSVQAAPFAKGKTRPGGRGE